MKKKHARRKPICREDNIEFGLVLLTQNQYEKLVANFGEDLTKFAISLLNDKIKYNPQDKRLVNAVNHYQYFRKDGKLICFALEVMNISDIYGPLRY